MNAIALDGVGDGSQGQQTGHGRFGLGPIRSQSLCSLASRPGVRIVQGSHQGGGDIRCSMGDLSQGGYRATAGIDPIRNFVTCLGFFTSYRTL
jgi:hypothetical protein